MYVKNEKVMKDEVKKLKRKFRDVEVKNEELEIEIIDFYFSREEEVNRKIEEVRRRFLRSGLDDFDEDFFKSNMVNWVNDDDDEEEDEEDDVELEDEDRKSDNEDKFDENFILEIIESSYLYVNRRFFLEFIFLIIVINKRYVMFL